MPDQFQYDVFLSHSEKDKGVVRPLAERLRADGRNVWPVLPKHQRVGGFDEWDIFKAEGGGQNTGIETHPSSLLTSFACEKAGALTHAGALVFTERRVPITCADQMDRSNL